jgi:hypothetical protein
MINSRNILLMLAAIACIMVGAYASPTPTVIEPAGMDLSMGGMQISDPEHTAQYLEMTGAVRPSPACKRLAAILQATGA